MNKLKFYLWNAFFSGLIGMMVFIVSLSQWVWHNSFQKLFLYLSLKPFLVLLGLFTNLLFNMAIGAIIGTVSLFFVFQIFLKLTQRPLTGFISNFLVVAVLNIAGSIAVGVRNYQQFIQSLWCWSLPISEVLSIFLVSAWYRRLMFYKEKLELKKKSLHNQGDS